MYADAMGAPVHLASFRRYFITAQLVAGLAAAAKGFTTDGALGAVVGFVIAIPISASIVTAKLLLDRRSGPRPATQRTRWAAALGVGLAACVAIIAAAVALKRWA